MHAPPALPIVLSQASRNMGAVLILSFLGVMFGGSVLTWRIVNLPGYLESPLHQDLWRAGHAHAALFLLLTLVLLPWIDAARASEGLRWALRILISSASLTFPLAFFLGAPNPATASPEPALGLLIPGAILLAAGLTILAWALLRKASAPLGQGDAE